MASPGSTDLFLSHFEPELLDLAEEHPDFEQWSVAGRARKKPEGVEWWRANGPAMVDRYIEWRRKSGWRPWVDPDGKLAIELDIVVEVNDEPLKAFVDAVFVVPSLGNQLVIVDFKTGARTPESDLQLGVYRLGIVKKYGIDIRLGAYWMARKGELSEVFNLTHLKPELVELWYRRFKTARELGLFIPHPTFLCRACPMRDYCAAYGGKHQHLDPDNGGVNV